MITFVSLAVPQVSRVKLRKYTPSGIKDSIPAWIKLSGSWRNSKEGKRIGFVCYFNETSSAKESKSSPSYHGLDLNQHCRHETCELPHYSTRDFGNPVHLSATSGGKDFPYPPLPSNEAPTRSIHKHVKSPS